MIILSLPIEPVAKQRPRLRRFGGTYTPGKTKLFENTLETLVSVQYRGAPISGPLCVGLKFLLQSPKRPSCQNAGVRPDLDNYIKAVLDACNGLLWKDDGQIVRLESAKVYSPVPQIFVCLQTLAEWHENPVVINLN